MRGCLSSFDAWHHMFLDLHLFHRWTCVFQHVLRSLRLQLLHRPLWPHSAEKKTNKDHAPRFHRGRRTGGASNPPPPDALRIEVSVGQVHLTDLRREGPSNVWGKVVATPRKESEAAECSDGTELEEGWRSDGKVFVLASNECGWACQLALVWPLKDCSKCGACCCLFLQIMLDRHAEENLWLFPLQA